MKKILTIAFITIISILNFNCEENFNPKTDFQEKYFLFCIIQADGSNTPYTQSAVINKLYNVEGLNPAVNKQDPSVSGVCVLLGYKNKNYVMYEYSEKRQGSIGYDSSQIYYSCASPDLTLHPNDEVSIHARLPKGIIISGTTKIPGYLDLSFSYPFTHGISTLIDKFRWGQNWIISWQTNNNNLFFPKLTLNYSKQDSSGNKSFSKEIPVKINKSGKYDAIYPGYTYEKNISYDFDAIDSVMTQISKGDPQKSNYKNFSVKFTLKECDNNFSNYYASIHGSLDNYSIRLDESVYSNINGGAGIIGSIINFNKTFDLDRDYLKLFGYSK